MPGKRIETGYFPAAALTLAIAGFAVLGGVQLLRGAAYSAILAFSCAAVVYLVRSGLGKAEMTRARFAATLGTAGVFLGLAGHALPSPDFYAFQAAAAWVPATTAGLLLAGALLVGTTRRWKNLDSILAGSSMALVLFHLVPMLPRFMVGYWLAAFLLLPLGSYLVFRFWPGEGTNQGPLARMSMTRKVLWTSASGVFLAMVILKSAWVGDDAFISFRTVDNFLHGYGLTWNVGERVQTYTHPFWLIVMALGRLISGEFYYTSLAAGLVFSILAVLVIGVKMGRNPASVVWAVLVVSFSKAFIDYATSGLENPLAYLLLAAFLVEWFQQKVTLRSLFVQSLLAALITFNRMDLLLLVAPAVAVTVVRVHGHAGRKIWRPVLAGWAPFILWELFSLMYYGFPFPNTAYAKLGSGVPPATLIQQGFRFLLDSMWRDPVTLAVITGALVLPFFGQVKKNGPLVVGLLLYLLYILKVGGDFMSGRFLAVPFCMGLAMLVRSHSATVRTGALSWVLLAFFTTLLPQNPWSAGPGYAEQTRVGGIADERGFYFPASSMLLSQPGHPYGNDGQHPFSRWMKLGARTRAEGRKTIVHGAVGVLGYTAGPSVYVIDMMGLGDPLLARLPAVQTKEFRIGHYRRKIPGNYFDLQNGEADRLLSAGLDEYYRNLKAIISGPIFSLARLKSLAAVNAGACDHLLPRADFEKGRYIFTIPLSAATPYDNLVRAGLSAATAWEYDNALASFDAAIRNDPRRPAAYLAKGLVHQQRGQLDKTLEEYRRAAQYDPRAAGLVAKVTADMRSEAGSQP